MNKFIGIDIDKKKTVGCVLQIEANDLKIPPTIVRGAQ
ncbi:hypothetical protein ES703_62442 [subsurface metagenome]